MLKIFIHSRCRGRIGPSEEESRFGYPRFRGSTRHHPAMFAAPAAPTPGLLPHAAHVAHGPLGAHAALGHGALRAPPDDDALYETADAERLRDAPDSERWDFLTVCVRLHSFCLVTLVHWQFYTMYNTFHVQTTFLKQNVQFLLKDWFEKIFDILELFRKLMADESSYDT